MPMTERQYERLPAYAKRELERLRRDVDAYARALAQRDGEVSGADTFVDDYRGFRDQMPLGIANKVSFYPSGNTENYRDRVDAHIVRHRDGNWVEIHGGESLIVQPSSSNVIRVGTRRY